MDLIELISNLGFPIVISLILIVRVETKIDKLTESINNLIKEMQKLNKNI